MYTSPSTSTCEAILWFCEAMYSNHKAMLRGHTTQHSGAMYDPDLMTVARLRTSSRWPYETGQDSCNRNDQFFNLSSGNATSEPILCDYLSPEKLGRGRRSKMQDHPTHNTCLF